MTRNEYESRRRRIEEERKVGLDLVNAGYDTQVRALEMVWMSFSGEAPSVVPTPLSSLEAPLPAPEPPPPPKRHYGHIHADLMAVLPHLPSEFDRNDVCKALGYAPDRGTLYRLLHELRQEGTLSVRVRGGGRTPTRYSLS